MGQQASHPENTTKDLILLRVDVDEGRRSFRIMPRNAPLYQELSRQPPTYGTRITSLRAFNARCHSGAIAVYRAPSDHNVLRHVDAGGPLSPSDVLNMAAVGQRGGYLTADVTHRLSARDVELCA